MRKNVFRILVSLYLVFGMGCAAKPQKVIIAHRGAPGYLPEHTLESAAMAHSFKVDFIEPDVVLTKDNVPIVIHDIHLESTTDVEKLFPRKRRKDGHWYAIDFTLREIRRLSVHERFNIKQGKVYFPNRFPLNKSQFSVPVFSEMIELVQGLNKSTGRNIGIYPEIKFPEFHRAAGKDISKIVLKVLAKYGYTDRNSNLYLQCFYDKELIRIRKELKSKLKLVQLIAENSWNYSSTDYNALRTKEGIKKIATYADGIGPWIHHILVDKGAGNPPERTGLVKWAHKHGLFIHAFTFRADEYPKYVSSFDELLEKFLFEIGVDGIFTDFGDRAISFLKRPAS